MAVNESQWVMVRLTKQVHARLKAFAERFGEYAANHPERVAPWAEQGMALTLAVAELLRRNDAHAARGAAASKRRKKCHSAEAGLAPFNGFE